MIEATNFYLFERTVDHARLEALIAYALIFGVKNEFHETVARLSQMVSPTGTHPSNSSHGAPSVVAFSLASQLKASQQRKESIAQRNISAISRTLYGWAVGRGHTALVSLLLSERVIWFDDRLKFFLIDGGFPEFLHTDLKYIYYSGNEAIARLVLENLLKVPYRDKRQISVHIVSAHIRRRQAFCAMAPSQ